MRTIYEQTLITNRSNYRILVFLVEFYLFFFYLFFSTLFFQGKGILDVHEAW